MGIFIIVLSIAISFRFPWWLLADRLDFLQWYPSFGNILWVLKTLSVLISIIFIGYILFQLLKKDSYIPVFFFFGYIALSLILKKHHPFSEFPMYNHFHDEAYVLYITDEEDNLLPSLDISHLKGSELSALYHSYIEKNNYSHQDTMQVKETGQYILKQITKENTSWKVIRQHLYVQNDSLYTSNLTISE